MKLYFSNFLKYFYTDFLVLTNFIGSNLISLLYVFKIYLLNLFFKFDFNIILIFLLFIIFLTHCLYILLYNIIYFFLFKMVIETYKNLNEFKSYVIFYNYDKIYSKYYKYLLKVNTKQYLIGSGLVLFSIICYLLINYYIQLKINSNIQLNFNINSIYSTSYILKNSIFINIKILFFNIIYCLISIYIILHIFFGLYNIFYDYLKDSALLLLLLITYIIYLFFFFNLFVIDIEFYVYLFKSYLLKI